MTTYQVNEIFDSVQGEGAHAGRPATFVRLQGCPVGCGFCDTKYTWSAGRPASWEAIERKDEVPDDRCAQIEARRLAEKLQARNARHVVITGGEPALYDLNPLTSYLYLFGISCQIETSGTHEVLAHRSAWVTCSPKVRNPAGLPVLSSAIQRADEIKMPVGKLRDIDDLRAAVMPFVREGTPVYLQPLSCSSKATALCIEQAMEHGWRVSVQVHRYLGLR